METIRVYTAITGSFEPVRHDIDVMTRYSRFVSPRLNAKIYKILPHLYFDEDITIWLDGNIRFAPETNIRQFVDDFLGTYDIGVYRHFIRNCAYQEAMACKNMGLDDPQVIIEQVDYYRHHDFPEEWGLAECGVIVRRNNTNVRIFNERWWAQVCRFSSRDQISFPFVWWTREESINIKLNDGNVRTDERFLYNQRQSSKA